MQEISVTELLDRKVANIECDLIRYENITMIRTHQP